MSIKFSVGMSYKTNSGRSITVLSADWVPGAKNRKRVYSIKWDNGETYKVTRRSLTKMVTGVDDGIEEGEEQDDDGSVRAEDTKPTTEAPSPEVTSDLAKMIASAVAPFVKSNVSVEDIHRIVDDRVVSMTLPRRVEALVPGTEQVKDVGVQHTFFEAIRRIMELRLNLWLVGPAGGGKTTIAESIAESMGLDSASLNVCQLTSKADLLGYRNVMDGTYVPTDLRRIYENGGVFLLDEVDAGNSNVLVIMNSLLANSRCPFPDGMVTKHKNFCFMSGANTVGTGANSQYNGRNALDGATLDRFVMMEFPYDPCITSAMCGVSPSAFSGMRSVKPFEFVQTRDASDEKHDKELIKDTERRCEAFCSKVVRVMNAVEKLKVRHIVGNRAFKNGTSLIRGGFTLNDAMKMSVWKGLDADTVAKIEHHADAA